jgi:uncharacterized membrane protein HdeD (DUF308 family)
MARPRKARRKKAAQPKRRVREGTMVLGRRNVLLLVAGIIVIIIGYFLLGQGSITVAPILLVVGYCVIIPLSIILWVKRADDRNQVKTGE